MLARAELNEIKNSHKFILAFFLQKTMILEMTFSYLFLTKFLLTDEFLL